MKTRFFISILILALIISCAKKNDSKQAEIPPSNIISSDEMASVLEDAFLVEGSVGLINNISQKSISYNTRRYYSYILKKHNITFEQFRESYTYFASNNDKMEQIMTTVINNLSEKQSKVRN
ncbi:MAG: DUF4296 domain-containing protein [Bacteroidetes bacterium]|nr:DUF4296 domain-containing protein [Bacteroidota bacterium]